jgi:hypothetical protein
MLVPAKQRVRVLHLTSPFQMRKRRECRDLAAPWPPADKQAAVTKGSAGSPGIPCAMVLTVSFALIAPIAHEIISQA